MDWYVVIKTINGRRYFYRQKTWREGKRVRTRSEYIGPAHDAVRPVQIDTTGAETLALPFKKDIDVDEALKVVLGPEASNPEIPWRIARRGPTEVELKPEITGMLKNLGVKWTRNTRGAYYNPNTDVVNIPPLRCFENKVSETATEAYYGVVFHELVHWTLHWQRTGRNAAEYAREELVAELGAVMLMQHFGLGAGNEQRHARYFQGWRRRCLWPDRALEHAKTDAAEAVRYILKHGKMSI